jgi:putative lipoic acid-binding regulatory protein
MKKKINYPAEITFKSVFSHHSDLHGIVIAILEEHGVAGNVSQKPSRNKKFISYTITAEFGSESHLSNVCDSLTAIQGFIMLM